MLGLTLALGATVGCSSSSNSGGSGTGGSATSGSGGSTGGAGGSTGGSGGSSGGAGGASGGCGGATPVALTVKNYLSWCNVSVAGGAAKSDATQTVCVAKGAVKLSATALPNFVLGSTPWHDTDGDKGSGDPGTVSGSGASATNSTTETTSGSSDCVWVCCPTQGANPPDCPATDQCP